MPVVALSALTANWYYAYKEPSTISGIGAAI
jgi:hypothetical protein